VTAARLIVAVLCLAGPASAQGVGDRPVRRLEVSAGGGWFGGAQPDTADADLRANTSPAEPLRLFSTETRMAGAPSIHAGVGFAFTRRWGVEGGVVVNRPELRTSISADTEGAPAITVVERIDQYIVEGRVVVMLEEMRLGQRTVPFATAGAGYLRQLHEGRTVIEEGHAYHVGGGLKHWLFTRDRGVLKAAGVRIDARLHVFVAGVGFDDGPRPHGAVSGSAFVTF
jgi:hypothetical protein